MTLPIHKFDKQRLKLSYVEWRIMKIEVLGGGGEIGRIGILLKCNEHDKKLLLDYGVMLTDGEPEFPLHVSPRELKAIVLSHAHLDHSGGIPLLYVSEEPKLITTKLTAEMTELLIQDFIKISGYYLPYESLELNLMLKNVEPVFYGQELKLGKIGLRFFNAGHIPGSMMTLIEVSGKRILYTGDINIINTRLLKGAPRKLPKVDLVIIEGTYATTDHPNRKELEKKFVAEVNEVVSNGGIVLIPAFSVGRSQEVLCILTAYKVKHKVYLDGMARKASRIMLRHPGYFRSYKLLVKALEKAIWISGKSHRKKACKNPGIIISPAGMLKGGTAVFYMKKLAMDEKNAVFLVSYQIPGTPGHILLEKGVFNFGDRIEKVKAKVEWFDFSSHCGRSELIEFIKRAREKGAEIAMIHCEKDSAKILAESIKDELGISITLPSTGEELII